MLESRRIKFIILAIGDLLILYGSLMSMIITRFENDSFLSTWNLHIIPFSILFFIWILTFISLGLYETSVTKNERRFVDRLFQAVIINSVISIVIFYTIPYFRISPRTNLFIILLISSTGIFLWRYIFNGIAAKVVADRILFFGISKEVAGLADYLKANPQFSLQPTVYVATDPSQEALHIQPVYSMEYSIRDLIKKFSITIIVVSENIGTNHPLVKIFFDTIPLGIRIIYFPAFYEAITGKIPVSLITEAWFLENFVHLRHAFYETLKRLLDILLAFCLGIITIILFPFITLAIVLETGWPILYKQKRIGKGGKEIEIIKFRSMIADAERGRALWADENDPRVTAVGLFLRKSRIDELPQLWNVFRGEMSFIGPRPERPEFMAILEKTIPFYGMRHLVAPGLTGWAQINFPYGASVEDAMEKLQYDLYYVKNRSILLDLTILLRTLVVIFSRSGR